MGLFDRLFGRKTEQPTAQKAEPSAEETPEQRRQKEIEIYVAKRGKMPRMLSEEEKARIREEQKKQKPISKEEREEIVRDLAKEMASYISIGESGNVSDRIPLEETPAFKRLEASGLQWKTPPPQEPESLVDYDRLIDEIVAETPHDVGAVKQATLKEIGVAEPICPYCGNVLEKMPGRKKKCPNCSNYVFVRTRPLDGKKVLIREDQKEEMEEQWVIKHETYEEQIESGAYGQSIKMLKHHLSGYQKSGREGWICSAALDEKDKPEYVNLHGQVFKFGSPEEIEALKLIIQPGSRCRPKAWFNDPRWDTDPRDYKKQRDEWFERMRPGSR